MLRSINMKKILFLILSALFSASAFAQSLPVMSRIVEDWQACGTSTASTSDIPIKAALTNAFIYVTSITCASSDADNASNINFKDGTTVIAVGGVNQMATTSAGTFVANFLTPLRTSKNSAFNFNAAVSTSSIICCATGYVMNQ